MSDLPACDCQRTRHRHGTKLMRERHRCPCFPCRVASAHARWLNRHGQTCTESTPLLRVGTRRRIQALHAIGWSGGEIANRLGVTFQNVHLMRGDRAVISPAVAERVAALYDELWDKPPVGFHVTKTRRWAARNGWAPPMAWDDDEIDDPDAVPQTGEHAPRELQPCGTPAAVRRHYRRGEPLDEACKQAEGRDRQDKYRRAAA